MRLKTTIFAALACAAAAAAATAPDWTLEVSEHGLRRATGHGSARFGEAEVPATLQLMCKPGAEGALSWVLTIERSAELVGFDFGAFEGPDAPARSQPLSRLDLNGGILRTGFAVATRGGFVDGTSFAFQFAAPATAASQGGLLAEAVDETSDSITWSVRSPEREDAKLATEFSAEGAVKVLQDAMLGCGPPPPLDAERIARWLGRNPHATGFFEQRAVRWRTHALLGREHDAALARFARAQPVAREGQVLFVLAPDKDEPRSGAVLMLEIGGSDVTLVTIDAGQVQRRTSKSTPLPAPAAVREFISARANPG